MPNKDLSEWINWNYLGLAASLLSVIVTIYNINNYWTQIEKDRS